MLSFSYQVVYPIFKNGWLTAFIEYNQIMRTMKSGNSENKTSKQKRSYCRTPELDEQTRLLSTPRKLVKFSQSFQNVSYPPSYSKIPFIPEIRLTPQQMQKDPIELLVSLEKTYEQFGAVKLIAPPEWRPPFCFNYGQLGITSRIQHLHKLKMGKMEFHPYLNFQITQAFKQNQGAYNVRNFMGMAQEFEKQYRFRTSPQGSNKMEKMQSEYWNLVNGKVEGPEWKSKVSVQYAADLPVNKYGSGFPLTQSFKAKDQNFDYYSSLFNLNNIYKSPNSILKISDAKKEYISGVTTPWVYMGMMFSTFCWHVEDLWLNSINYNHKGGVKTWYVIPRKYKEKFQKFVTKKTGQENLLDKITFMLDPLELIKNGIPVYKTYHKPGEYVCTFFKAFHAGFSLGFNVGQAVNFVSPISLNYIKQAINFVQKHKQKRPAVLSYEWLVYENKIQNQGSSMKIEMKKIIQQEYQRIVEKQEKWIKGASEKLRIVEGQIITANSKYDKNSCCRCHNYQYLSSLRCRNCKKNYCEYDIVKCCGDEFQLIYREPKQERAWIKDYFNQSEKIK